ncbi:MAG: TonB-dependent receptor [Bacteroidota bacterium]|nr:TonB-dependent receptor [Bacteroidota bacterium]
MRIALLICLFFLSLVVVAQTSAIKGRLTGRDHEPLAGAFVHLTNTALHTVTDSNGRFILANVPHGEYTLTVEYVGYRSVSRHVRLKENETEKIDIGMEVGDGTLGEVDVYGKISQEEDAGSRQREKRANNILNVISAKSMERSPDINAANVLQRMSGLTIQHNGGGDEAYPIVRGLDPRYTNTLIDGIKITSPDDKSRYVPLNMVPSDLLGSIEVHKSLLPEMEGDAIGGTVNMVMKDAPGKTTFRLLGSLGYNKIFMDQSFNQFSRSDISQKSPIEKYGSSYIAQPNDFSRSNLKFDAVRPIPNTVAALTWGRRFARRKFGLLLAAGYQNQYYGSNSIFNQAAPDIHSNGAPAISDFANRSFSTQQMNSGLTLHLDYHIDEKNKISLTSVGLYSLLAQSRVIIDTSIFGGNGGRTVPGTGPVSTDYTTVTSRQFLETTKLEGKHILSDHFLLDWTGVYSYAAKRTPDMADLSLNKKIDTVHTTGDQNGPYSFVETANYFDDITRIWQHNEDQDLDGMANLSYKSKLHSGGLLELKVGGLYRHKTRYNIQDSYDLKPTTASNGVKQVFTNIDSAQWTVYNSSGTYDYDKNKYRLYENVAAGYGEFKVSVPLFDVFGGMRVEKTEQGYSLNTFYPAGINGVKKNYTDLLPSIMVRFKLNEKTNLRASYYKGISRPNYYDLVPATRLSVSSATATTGNPYLNHTVSDNYDLRYEYYPHEEEAFFAGIFYKSIQNPIESAYVSGTTFEPENFGTAMDYGLELAYTRYFGKLGITGNYTYLDSRISSTKSYYNLATGYAQPDTLQERSLQGQTDHTLNLSLLYRDTKKGSYVQLAFQYIGKSIALVYPIYGYDYYQQPQSNLSLSAEQQLRNHRFVLFTKWNNLLNTAVRQQINSLLVDREITKLNFSFGLRYSQ